MFRWLRAVLLWMSVTHPCSVCHMNPGHLPDLVVEPQPPTPQEQKDPTPNDNDGGIDDNGTPADPSVAF